MIILVIIWVVSLISLGVVFWSAYAGIQSSRSEKYLSRGLPVGWWDLLVLTYQDVIGATIDLWHEFLPHVHNGVTHVLAKTLAKRDKLYARLFGYPAVPQGGVVSFFLKRIVAHKEEFRQKMEEKKALDDESVTEIEKERINFAEIKIDSGRIDRE